jgi:hypothetical protein
MYHRLKLPARKRSGPEGSGVVIASHARKIARKIVTTGFLLGTVLFLATAYAADQKKLSPCEISYPSDETIEW